VTSGWWAGAVTSAEVVSRRIFRSRSAYLAVVYGGLLPFALGATGRTEDRSRVPVSRPGVAAAVIGYPLGRALLGDRPQNPPPDGLFTELLVLGVLVPTTEEVVWGRLVEGELGRTTTAALFALKHGVVDGRWRRLLGLGLFWGGLGLVRRTSPPLARGLHIACNTSGVVLGHALGLDQF
jgi:hypothetical protein